MKKILLLLILPIYLMSYDFANNREVQRFMDEMHQKHNFNKEYLPRYSNWLNTKSLSTLATPYPNALIEAMRVGISMLNILLCLLCLQGLKSLKKRTMRC